MYMICKQVSLQVKVSLEKPEYIYWLSVNWFQVFLFSTNNSIWYSSFVWAKLDGLKNVREIDLFAS